MGRGTLLAVIALTVGGCAGPHPPDPYDEDQAFITAYCSYGSTTVAQLDSCQRHVGRARIRGLDTNAARFAKGQLTRCLRDAGPFCRAP